MKNKCSLFPIDDFAKGSHLFVCARSLAEAAVARGVQIEDVEALPPPLVNHPEHRPMVPHHGTRCPGIA